MSDEDIWSAFRAAGMVSATVALDMFERPKRPKAINDLHSLMAVRPKVGTLWTVIRDFSSPDRIPEAHTDRAAVLVLGSALEQALENAILTHCIKLSEEEIKSLFGGGDMEPISFAAKTKLGYALGIYGQKSKGDIDLLRLIRNIFAHSKLHIDFSHSNIIQACESLTYVQRVTWEGALESRPTTPRELFTRAIEFYFVYLAGAEDKGSKPLRYNARPNPNLYS